MPSARPPSGPSRKSASLGSNESNASAGWASIVHGRWHTGGAAGEVGAGPVAVACSIGPEQLGQAGDLDEPGHRFGRLGDAERSAGLLRRGPRGEDGPQTGGVGEAQAAGVHLERSHLLVEKGGHRGRQLIGGVKIELAGQGDDAALTLAAGGEREDLRFENVGRRHRLPPPLATGPFPLPCGPKPWIGPHRGHTVHRMPAHGEHVRAWPTPRRFPTTSDLSSRWRRSRPTTGPYPTTSAPCPTAGPTRRPGSTPSPTRSGRYRATTMTSRRSDLGVTGANRVRGHLSGKATVVCARRPISPAPPKSCGR